MRLGCVVTLSVVQVQFLVLFVFIFVDLTPSSFISFLPYIQSAMFCNVNLQKYPRVVFHWLTLLDLQLLMLFSLNSVIVVQYIMLISLSGSLLLVDRPYDQSTCQPRETYTRTSSLLHCRTNRRSQHLEREGKVTQGMSGWSFATEKSGIVSSR